MRILYVCNHIGTFVMHRLPLAVEGARRGHEVHLTGPGEPEAAAVLAEHGVAVHPLADARGSLNPFALRRAALSLAGLCGHLRPDLVHAAPLPSILTAGLALGRLARRTAGDEPALVGSVTGLGYLFTDGRGRLRRRLLRAAATPLLRHALARPRRAVIFQNPDDRAVLVGAGIVPEAATVLIRGSGVDLARYAFSPEPPVPPEGPEILLPARMLRDKGVEEFAAAARALKNAGTRLRCVLLGDTDPKNPSAVPAATLRGWVDEGILSWEPALPPSAMAGRLARTHIVCLPSYREGLSKSILEALATGRAVVATDAPGCRDAVAPGVNGWLAAPRDSGSLAKALAEAAADSERRQAYGRAGRRRAEKEFSLPVVLDATFGLYERLAGGGVNWRG